MNEKGKGRRCLFCGETPVTGEHLWPDWVRRLLDESEMGTYTFRGTDRDEVSFTRLPYTLEVRVACGACNGGWMSDLENLVRPFAAGMIEGRGRTLHEHGQSVLAAWATKTAMVYQGTVKRSIIPPEHMREMRACADRPPEGTFVFIAGYQGGKHAGVFRNRLLRLDRSSFKGRLRQRVLSEDDGDMYLVTFSVNHLVFQVFRSLGEPLELVNSEHNPALRRIFPSTGSFTFPPGPRLRDADLQQLGSI